VILPTGEPDAHFGSKQYRCRRAEASQPKRWLESEARFRPVVDSAPVMIWTRRPAPNAPVPEILEMHGIIFAELRNYAETKHGKGTWNQLLKKAGLENKFYLPINAYPDTEVVALVGAASSMAGIPVAELVEDFWRVYHSRADENVWAPAAPRMEDDRCH
jgi:hypothetical protein